MTPPLCELCGLDVRSAPPDASFDLVRFADYEPLPDGMPGHPHGLVWFCSRHIEAARVLSGLPTDEALAKLRRRYRRTVWLGRWRRR